MNIPEPYTTKFNGFEYDENHKIDFANRSEERRDWSSDVCSSDLNQLRRLRKLHNVSCAKLAKAIGVSKCTIVNYENYNNRPTVETACRLAVFFGVSLDELVYGHIPTGLSGYTEF